MSTWFDFVLDPSKLTSQFEANASHSELLSELNHFLTNILNHQSNGFFAEDPQQLCYAEDGEKKVAVLRSLCLRIGSYCEWCLGKLESALPSPLLLYLLQALLQAQPQQQEPDSAPPPDAPPATSFYYRHTPSHTSLPLREIPGPALHALTLFHRWVVRAFMSSRTPTRAERSPVVTVPGLLRDPAVVYRDQTNTLISAVATTSIKFLQAVLDSGVTPSNVPSHRSFQMGTRLVVSSWEHLQLLDPATFRALLSYDLGCCYFFCEDYTKARQCFTTYKSVMSATADPACVDQSLLLGYLAALNMTIGGSVGRQEEQTAQTRLIQASQQGYHAVLDILDEDNKTNELQASQREMLELELTEMISRGKMTATKDFLPVMAIQNMVKRTMRGLPLTSRSINSLRNQPDTVVRKIEDNIATAFKRSDAEGRKKLRLLVQELVLHGVLADTSSLLPTVGMDGKKANILSSSCSISPGFSLISDTHGMDKIGKLNMSLQLLVSFSPITVSSMARANRLSRKTSQRWHLEDHLARAAPGLAKSNGGSADLVYILLAKVNQLKRMNCYGEARGLLNRVQNELTGGKSADRSLAPLSAHVSHEQLVVDLLSAVTAGAGEGQLRGWGQDMVNRAGQCLAASAGGQEQAPAPPVVEQCLAVLLNSGDWDGVIRLTNGRPGMIPTLARSLALLMVNLRVNNPQHIKKFCRELWDLVTPLVSGAAKRNKDGNTFAPVKERTSVTAFLGQLFVPGLVSVVLSLLAAMHNAARDDPSTEIQTQYVNMWPTGLSTNGALQDRQVDDVLTSVLTTALKSMPKEPELLQMMADLNYSNSHYAMALALYVETAAVKTDFFQIDCGPLVLDDTAILRMVRCCTELGRLTQAVVLMQFTQDPNYAQAFKYLEDRDSSDGSDSLYGCVWDMAILEFAMSLHTKRGEVARRQQALNCIMQLELNTNNEDEIQKEAANIRKAMFMRSLALQFF